MDNIKDQYTKEHLNKDDRHLYPTEWVVRTMLGNYPELKFNRSIYQDAKILDMGFGDCRNMRLLDNIGLEIHGVEITEDIVKIGRERCDELNIKAILKVGDNRNIPFDKDYFDIILSSSSMYYVDKGITFDDILLEYNRVLKKGGYLIANFPELSKNFIFKGGINKGNNHM